MPLSPPRNPATTGPLAPLPLSANSTTRFAVLWNEVVTKMREEDIISNRELAGLKYLLVRMPATTSLPSPAPKGINTNISVLKPAFLYYSGVSMTVEVIRLFSQEESRLITILEPFELRVDQAPGLARDYNRAQSDFLLNNVFSTRTSTDTRLEAHGQLFDLTFYLMQVWLILVVDVAMLEPQR